MKRPRYVIPRASDEMYADEYRPLLLHLLLLPLLPLSVTVVQYSIHDAAARACILQEPASGLDSVHHTLPYASLQTLTRPRSQIGAAIKQSRHGELSSGAPSSWRQELLARHRASEKPFEYSSGYGHDLPFVFGLRELLLTWPRFFQLHFHPLQGQSNTVLSLTLTDVSRKVLCQGFLCALSLV